MQEITEGTTQHIVVVGGGFGGIRAALNLANKPGFKVTLISDQSYFEYRSVLYRSATGRSPLESAIPLADFFEKAGNVEVVVDPVVAFDVTKKTVTGKSESVWHYDALVLALGSVTNYFHIEGLDKYSYGVKSVNEALELKRHIHDTLVTNHDEGNYVVVGGGPTGIELSSELITYLKHVRNKHNVTSMYSVHLIEAAPHLLPLLPQKFTKLIEKHLIKLGIKLQLNTAIKGETYEGIEMPGDLLRTHTVVWTAGTSINPLIDNNPAFKMTKRHRVEVDEHLQAAPDVYVVGDCADTQYTGMAQTAIHDANFVTGNLIRRSQGKEFESYEATRPIYAIPAGSYWSAVLFSGKWRIYGFPGWLLRRAADLKLYFTFLPPAKALSLWGNGIKPDETCPICSK